MSRAPGMEQGPSSIEYIDPAWETDMQIMVPVHCPRYKNIHGHACLCL